MKKNIIKEKSFEFALLAIELNKRLMAEKEFVISKQILRSGTAVGALIREAEHAESTKDFIHKLSISLKEANETIYWLELLYNSQQIKIEYYTILHSKIEEILKILITIIKSCKQRIRIEN
jgi:four helix bundle protein